jgi:hypothetical protein
MTKTSSVVQAKKWSLPLSHSSLGLSFNVFFITAIALVSASCGPRHIDYDLGDGPQGGQAPFAPSKPTVKFIPLLRLLTDDSQEDLRAWHFRLDVDFDGWKNNFAFFISDDPAHENGLSTDLSDRATCVGPSAATSFADCTDLKFSMPAFWNTDMLPSIANFSVEVNAHRTQGCAVRGQFPWESESTLWATGETQSILFGAAEPADAQFYALNSTSVQMFLVPDYANSREPARTLSLEFKKTNSASTFLFFKMRFPSFALNDERVLLSSDQPFASIGYNRFHRLMTSLQFEHFEPFEQSQRLAPPEVVTAYLELSCEDGPRGVARDLRPL